MASNIQQSSGDTLEAEENIFLQDTFILSILAKNFLEPFRVIVITNYLTFSLELYMFSQIHPLFCCSLQLSSYFLTQCSNHKRNARSNKLPTTSCPALKFAIIGTNFLKLESTKTHEELLLA